MSVFKRLVSGRGRSQLVRAIRFLTAQLSDIFDDSKILPYSYQAVTRFPYPVLLRESPNSIVPQPKPGTAESGAHDASNPDV